ncbi:hypothetical protein ACFV2D_35890 [Streptomyces capillispiralis]|uniref:hypothetical protein n=1 Tax=Streptomyces capillispiralis TaxID=68182 RepID=UPI0036BFC17B
MTPIHFGVLALVLLASLAGGGIRRAATSDIPAVLVTITRALVVLALGSLGLLLVDPADVPSVLRAVMPGF